jgi:hypothetical protein
MQQQMLDQFQQSMQMIVQTFASMHRDQMTTLQKELDHIHRITRELNELQAEAKAAQQRGLGPQRNGSWTRPAPPRPSAAQSAPRQPEPAPRRNAPAGTPERPQAGSPSPAAAGAAAADIGDMHDWLNQRIRNLQNERESSWQRILGFVLGK